jgi:hypothetical protein
MDKPDNTKDDRPVIDVSDINDFDKLLDMVKLDANLVDGLTEDQVTELRKKLNPYGSTINGKGSLTCMSVTNLSEQYMKRFLMTSLIGFLYRQCDEYELDDGEPPCHLDDYDAFMLSYTDAVESAKESRVWLDRFLTLIDVGEFTEETLSGEQKAERLIHRRIISRGEGFQKRLVVRQFLDGLFQFNPDKHARSAYSSNPLDPERVIPAQIRTKKTNTFKKISIGKSGSVLKIDNTNKMNAEPESEPEPELEPESEPELEPENRSNNTFVNHIPPADVFHRWTYYTDSNYEEVRTAVCDLYADKPDFEFAINPYDRFNNKEDAENFVLKHKNETIADIVTLHNNKWNLLGSFKKNRERVNFYNEKTEVIEEIFKQLEKDTRLGAELMRKRVKRKKKVNINESGPDPEEFKQYKKNNPSSFENMGAEDVSRENNGGDDEKNTSFKVHEDCPYDSVQVDVFDFRQGGKTVKKSEFFTESEAPKNLRE